MYTIEYVDTQIDVLTDKLGSDYFPLEDIKWGRFVSMARKFVEKNSIFLEGNQNISDNIKSLLISEREIVLTPENDYLIAAEPMNYYRLVSLCPLKKINNEFVRYYKRVKIAKEGQNLVINRNPFSIANEFYPVIYRTENFFKIDLGGVVNNYEKGLISYIKQPSFGDISNTNNIAVDLPFASVDKIIEATAASLRVNVDDSAITNFEQFYDIKK